MKKLTISVLSCAIMSFSLTSCLSTGMHASTNITNVELSNANYRIIARSVKGEAQAGYLFGASYGVGMYTAIFGVARISGERALYQAAMDNLWASFESQHGSVAGRRLALVNIRYDVNALNLFVYTQPHLTIQADVIEFGQ
jgi:hypothetical protein